MDKKENPFRCGRDERSLRGVFDTLCDTWEKFRLNEVAEYGDKIIDIIQDLEEGDYYLAMGNASLQALNDLYSSYNDRYRQNIRSTESPIWGKYREIKEEGGPIIPNYAAPLFTSFLEDNLNVEYIEEEDENEEDGPSSRDKFCKCTTPQNREIYWVDAGYEQSDIVTPDSKEEGLKAWEEVVSLIWDDFDNHIEMVMDEKKDDFLFQRKKRLPWEYRGEQGQKLIERWKNFKEEGIRRSIILHGKPGTGKSTLARHATKELEGRVIFTPVRTILDSPSVNYFSTVLEALRPDILVIDDFDRLHRSALETLLDFFEETENPVPFIMATTNHLDELPDAIKRPGRFDEIWKINPPSDEIRQRVIMYLAELEDFDISEEQAEKVAGIAKERDLPGSHIREIIRRVKVMGENELDFNENDLTFDDDWNLEKDSSSQDINGPLKDNSGQFTLEEF